jgi:DtxR family Mn-dependent transcriptional regulator
MDPGLEGTVVAGGDADEVAIETADGERLALTRSVAETVSVVADPSPPPRVALPAQLVLGEQRYGR